MCSALPIWEMVLISYSVINIIYRRYCRNGFQCKPCLFGSYFTAVRRLLELTRRQNWKHTAGSAVEGVWVVTTDYINGTYGMERLETTETVWCWGVIGMIVKCNDWGATWGTDKAPVTVIFVENRNRKSISISNALQ
jgi:hypothetical protein